MIHANAALQQNQRARMQAVYESIIETLSPALGWLAIAILVLLALLSRKPPGRGKRTSD